MPKQAKAPAEGIAVDRLKSFIERVERLDEEKRALLADIAEVYKEAKGAGFDVKTMRKIVAERRKDQADRQEERELFDLYARAVGLFEATPLGEAAAERESQGKAGGEAQPAVH